MTVIQGERTITDPEQVVLESEPFRRLSYTWPSSTPDWAQAHGLCGEEFAAVSREPPSRVSLDLEPEGPLVRLTVVHDGFGPDSSAITSICRAWPQVLSALKSLLETGE